MSTMCRVPTEVLSRDVVAQLEEFITKYARLIGVHRHSYAYPLLEWYQNVLILRVSYLFLTKLKETTDPVWWQLYIQCSLLEFNLKDNNDHCIRKPIILLTSSRKNKNYILIWRKPLTQYEDNYFFSVVF